VDKLLALGIISVLDLEEVGVEPLVSELGLDDKLARIIVSAAAEEAKKLAAEKRQSAQAAVSKLDSESELAASQEDQDVGELEDSPSPEEATELETEAIEAEAIEAEEIEALEMESDVGESEPESENIEL
ncbi:unnamed protein product, partial [marine sediment metagenome]